MRSVEECLAAKPGARSHTARIPRQEICAGCRGTELVCVNGAACDCAWLGSVVAEHLTRLLVKRGYARRLSHPRDVTGEWLPFLPPPREGQPLPPLSVCWSRAQDPESASLSSATAEAWLRELEELHGAGARTVWLIHRKRRQPVTKLMASRARALGWVVEFWAEDELLFPPDTHGPYFAEHQVLSVEEVGELAQTYSALPHQQFPLLHSGDPAARWWGIQPGDIVRVDSWLDGAEQPTYRRCGALEAEQFRRDSIVPKKPRPVDRQGRYTS